MCLIYSTALNLLQPIETEEQGRRTGRWNKEEGMKVANLLGERSLIKTSTFEGKVHVRLNNVVIKKKEIQLKSLEEYTADTLVKPRTRECQQRHEHCHMCFI